MVAETVRLPESAQSPFAGLASTGTINSKGGQAQGATSGRVLDSSRPPRMPEDRRSRDGEAADEAALDSPVSGLVEATTPGVNSLQIQSVPSGILKEEGSVRAGMRRAVSWADFSHEDPARLTQVVEFERDGPSSPTSVDSWDGQETVQCNCCWIQ